MTLKRTYCGCYMFQGNNLINLKFVSLFLSFVNIAIAIYIKLYLVFFPSPNGPIFSKTEKKPLTFLIYPNTEHSFFCENKRSNNFISKFLVTTHGKMSLLLPLMLSILVV